MNSSEGVADDVVEGCSWAASREDRRVLCRCGMCGALEGEECRPGFWHAGRRFEVSLCWPGDGREHTAVGEIDGRCRATVESTYSWDFDTPGRHCDVAARRAIVSRGACLGCGWAASVSHCNDGNAAIEDALDHALVGWRAVPLVKRHRHDASDKAFAKWMREVGVLYEQLGLDAALSPERGGVIRTCRVDGGTRSHWSRGFYDMCGAVVAEDPERRGRPLSERSEQQLGLF